MSSLWLQGKIVPALVSCAISIKYLPNAGERWSAARYLAEWGPQIFPPYFESVLHPLFASVLKADPDRRVSMLSHAFPGVRGAIMRCTAPAGTSGEPPPDILGSELTHLCSKVCWGQMIMPGLCFVSAFEL